MTNVPPRNDPFRINPLDWLTGQELSTYEPEVCGAMLLLLALSWSREDCSVPDDELALSRITRLRDRWAVHRETVLSAFPPHPTLAGRRANADLLAQRERATGKSR